MPRVTAKGVAVDRNVGRAGADVRAVSPIGLLLATSLQQDALTEAVDLPVIDLRADYGLLLGRERVAGAAD